MSLLPTTEEKNLITYYEIVELTKQFPNDQELGREVRKIISSNCQSIKQTTKRKHELKK